jgi:alpha-methylacyl-CoA racemase
MEEAAGDPHARAREAFVTRDGIVQPGAAPRFDRTPGRVGDAPPEPGTHTDEVLGDAGYDAGQIRQLRESGVVG